MDILGETQRLKLWLVVGVLFLVSTYASCQEMKYFAWGRTTDAAETATRKTLQHSKRQTWEVLEVQYEYAEEDGTVRRGSMIRPLEWARPADDRIRIEYQPGSARYSRPPPASAVTSPSLGSW